jgi:hypothetical protein
LDIERLELADVKRRAYACYKVDEIRAERPFSVPFPVHFEVDVEGNVEFEMDSQLELLPESLRSEVRTLTADRIAALSTRTDRLRAFIEHFDDELLARYLVAPADASEKGAVIKADGRISLRKDPSIDFHRYVHDVHGQANGEVYDGGKSQALLGALYMPKCQPHLLEGLGKALSLLKKTVDAKVPPAIFWVIPDTELWGRTSLVRELILGIRAAFKDVLGSALGFLTQYSAKLQKMAGFALLTLAASLHAASRGGGDTPGERRFRFEDADVAEFTFLDSCARAP